MYREVVSLDTLAKAHVKVPQVLDSNTREYADETVELYFVMEYIPGKTLKDEIIARGRLPLEKAAVVAMELCKTVAAGHQNDVLHRDLKPDNIIVRGTKRGSGLVDSHGNMDETSLSATLYLRRAGGGDVAFFHEVQGG